LPNCIACEEMKPEDEICFDGFCRACAFAYGSPQHHPRRVRKRAIKSDYGLEYRDYSSMYAQQGGRCRICCKKLSKYRGGDGVEVACVDHNHATGEVRGLLCRKCNIGLGHFNEDVTILDAAIDYILDFQ